MSASFRRLRTFGGRMECGDVEATGGAMTREFEPGDYRADLSESACTGPCPRVDAAQVGAGAPSPPTTKATGWTYALRMTSWWRQTSANGSARSCGLTTCASYRRECS